MQRCDTVALVSLRRLIRRSPATHIRLKTISERTRQGNGASLTRRPVPHDRADQACGRKATGSLCVADDVQLTGCEVLFCARMFAATPHTFAGTPIGTWTLT